MADTSWTITLWRVSHLLLALPVGCALHSLPWKEVEVEKQVPFPGPSHQTAFFLEGGWSGHRTLSIPVFVRNSAKTFHC